MMTFVLFLFLLVAAPVLHAQTPEAEAMRMEMVFWESVRNSSDPADFRAYLEQYPKGRFAPLARNRLSALEPKPATKPPAAPPSAPSAAPQASSAPAGPAREGPPAAGDTWTYHLVDGKTGKPRAQHEVRLVSVAGDTLVEEVATLGDARSRIEHRRGNYTIYPSGEITLFAPYLIAFGTPLQGPINVEVLDMRTCSAGWTCSVRGRVVGRDRVRVPAGTFEAIRVEISQYWAAPPISYSPGESVTRTLTVWYAPEVKRAVKFSGRGSPSRTVDTEFDVELVSYKLN